MIKKWICKIRKNTIIPVALILMTLMMLLVIRVEAFNTGLRFRPDQTAQPAATPTLSLSPSDSAVSIGGQVSVDIVVENVSNLYGIALDISFNPSLVAVVDMNSGEAGVQITPGSCPVPNYVAKNSTDNTIGLIEYDVSSVSPSVPCNGSGTIATITFEGKATGTSALHFDSWLLSDTDGIEISASATDGTINVGEVDGQDVFLPLVLKSGAGGEAMLKFSPASSSVGTGDQVTVDIVVEDLSDLYGIALDIHFDPSLVAVVDMNSGEAGVQITPGSCPSPDFVLKNSTNNTTGLIEYDLTALSPSAPCSGSGTIATITFEGIMSGTSALSFDTWLLSDPDGFEITATAQAGSIQVTE